MQDNQHVVVHVHAHDLLFNYFLHLALGTQFVPTCGLCACKLQMHLTHLEKISSSQMMNFKTCCGCDR